MSYTGIEYIKYLKSKFRSGAFYLPPKGYRNISIKESLYRELEKFMIQENAKAGYRKWKSIAEIVEAAVKDFLEKHGVR